MEIGYFSASIRFAVSITVLGIAVFGRQRPAYHVQQFDHQGYLASLTQYSFEGLPSIQTAPGHPTPCSIPFMDVGRASQSNIRAESKCNISIVSCNANAQFFIGYYSFKLWKL